MLGAVILQVILIFLNAVFASAEIAVISLNEARLRKLEKEGNKRAKKLVQLTEQPARFLATIQVAITMAGLLGSAFAAENFADPLVQLLTGAGVVIPEKILKSAVVFLITLVLAYFNLVFGELVPKRIAMKKSEALAIGMSNMLYGVSRIFAPIVFLLTVSTNFVLRLLGINPEEDGEQVTEEEIRMLLITGNEQGTIDAEENEMIQNIFEFDDLSVEQICTRRMDVIALMEEDALSDWEEVIHNSRHTFYPLCRESKDQVVGILDTKDYFRLRGQNQEQILQQSVDKPYFIPETMKANVLFQNMKHSRIYFAVVIDEYGGLSGIVTLHDLMEALVGELAETEGEQLPKAIENLGEGKWRIYGYAELDQVEKELGIVLPSDRYETYNGFVCDVIERIPDDGESFECVGAGLHILVHSVKDHRVDETTVQILGE